MASSSSTAADMGTTTAQILASSSGSTSDIREVALSVPNAMDETINQFLRSQDDINSEILKKIPTGVNFGAMPMGPCPSEQELIIQLQR
jgi:hypothetical protein